MTTFRRILALAFLFAARAVSADCPAGPFTAGDSIRCTFNTQTAALVTLGGTPVVSVYKDSNLSQTTTGVTLSVDFDSLTGLQHVAVDTSADGTFYANGHDYQIVVTTGTVGGVSVAGATVGAFHLGASSSSTAPTAAQNAAAVWAYLTASATTANSMGAYIIQQLGLISAGSITIRPPVNIDGSLDLVAGDSHTYAEGTAIDFAKHGKPWPSDLTGYTITITADSADWTTLFTDTLTIVTATGTTATVRWQPTASKTSVTPGNYSYEVKAVKGSEVNRLELGVMRIRAGTT